MASCLQQYFATENVTNLGQRLWSSDTILWPTILALAVSLVSIVLSTIVLFAYFWGTKAADRWDNWRGYFTNTTSAVKIAFHIAVAVSLFVTGTNPNSLQGQTCGAPPAKEPLFPQLNFGKFCAMQVIILPVNILIVAFCRIYDAYSDRNGNFERLHLRLELLRREK